MITRIDIDLDILHKLSGNASATLVYHYIKTLYDNTKSTEEGRDELRRNDGWFRCPFGVLRDRLGMKPYKVRSAIQALMNDNLLDYKNKGLPKTMWVKILKNF